MEVKKSKKHIFIIIGVVILLLLVPIIYGVVKDCYQEPVKDAVVKLIEVICDCGKEERSAHVYGWCGS